MEIGTRLHESVWDKKNPRSNLSRVWKDTEANHCSYLANIYKLKSDTCIVQSVAVDKTSTHAHAYYCHSSHVKVSKYTHREGLREGRDGWRKAYIALCCTIVRINSGSGVCVGCVL